MASFSYRTPQMNFLTSLPRELQESSFEIQGKRFLEVEKKSVGLFDWHLNESKLEFITSKGVYVSPNSFNVHSHPLSKTIENHFIFNVLPSLFYKNFLLISCKQHKLDRLSTRCGNSLHAFNRVVETKDRSRYGSVPQITSIEKFAKQLGKDKHLFFFDELHHWPYKDFYNFLSLKEPDSVYCTVVFPIEVLSGYKRSLNPAAYEFELRGDKMFFAPDGNFSEAYEQTLNPWIFNTRSITLKNGVKYSFKRHSSIGAHHLFLIEKGDLITDTEDIYQDFPCVAIDELMGLPYKKGSLRARRKVICAIISYLLALKQPNVESACAKVRSLADSDFYMDEIIIASHACKIISEKSHFNMLGDRSLLSKLFLSIKGIFPSFLRKAFGDKDFNSEKFLDFITQLRPKLIFIKKKDQFDVFSKPVDPLESGYCVDEDVILREFEDKFFFGAERDHRERAPYESDLCFEFHVERVDHGGFLDCGTSRTPVGLFTTRTEYLDLTEKPEEEMSFEEARFHGFAVFAIEGSEGLFIPRRLRSREPNNLLRISLDPKVKIYSIPNEDVEMELCVGEDTQSVSLQTPNAMSCFPSTSTQIVSDRPNDVKFLGQIEIDNVEFAEISLPHPDLSRGRSVGFFSKGGEGYEYIGGKHLSLGWPEELDSILEKTGVVGYNFRHCLYQVYSKGGKIPFHSDDEPCYSDNTVILTINLTGSARFSIKNKRTGESSHCILERNDMFLMPEGFQKEYLHSVEALTERSSLTFRGEAVEVDFDLEDVCDVPEFDFDELVSIVRSGKSTGVCLLQSIADHIHVEKEIVLSILLGRDPSWGSFIIKDEGCTKTEVSKALFQMGISGSITEGDIVSHVQSEGSSFRPINLLLKENHVSLIRGPRLYPKELLDVRSIFLKGVSGLRGLSKGAFSSDVKSAEICLSSFQNGYTGVYLNNFKKGKEVSIVGEKKGDVFVCFGFAGSGKTFGLTTFLKSACNYRDVLVISPRKALLGHISKELEQLEGRDNHIRFATFEIALTKVKKSKIVVVDEVGLYPHGYIDLLTCLNPDAEFVFIGDPVQGFYHARSDCRELKGARSSFNVFENFKFDYKLYSHRISRELDLFDFECMGREKRNENHLRVFENEAALFRDLGELPWLCPNEEGSGQFERYAKTIHTFGTAQGLSFNFGVIVLNHESTLASEQQWMVAITRFRDGFCFLRHNSISSSDFNSKMKGKFIWKVMHGIKISKEHVVCSAGKIMHSANILLSEEKFKKTLAEKEEALEGDPWLKGQLRLLEDVEMDSVELLEPTRHDSPPKTHSMHAAEGRSSIITGNMKARENREFRGKMDWSYQFVDTDHKKRNVHNPILAVETIYPRHTSQDDLTLWAAIKKRLSFSCPQKESRKLQRDMEMGKVLFDALMKWIPFRKLPVDIEKCEKEFVEKRLSKSRGLISSHAERSDPDWDLNWFFLFMKTQLCTKFEKRLCDAKAGQTLACFSHNVLNRFGIPTRVMEDQIKRQLPNGVYLHTMKNFDDLNDFVIRNITRKDGTDSDYEAFDRSQDSLILAFEIHLLRHFGWEEDLIQDYIKIKLNLGCRLGNLAIMRFTGEFGTFLFNSLANMAFTCIRYELKEGVKICFAGDDMYMEGPPRLRYDYEWLINKMSLKAKVNYSDEPIFCGWRIHPHGIAKIPRLILERFQIAEERGNIKECFINYAIEASYAYRLGERLWELKVDPEDHQEVIRKIVLKANLLPKRIKALFTSQDDGFDPSEQVQESRGGNWEPHTSCGLRCSLH